MGPFQQFRNKSTIFEFVFGMTASLTGTSLGRLRAVEGGVVGEKAIDPLRTGFAGLRRRGTHGRPAFKMLVVFEREPFFCASCSIP